MGCTKWRGSRSPDENGVNSMTCESTQIGYQSRAYAESLVEFGELLELSRSGGHLLVRPIAGTGQCDAMGCYPLFLCEDWAALAADMEDLPEDILSVSLVADPFGRYTREVLDECFDVVNPFKQHYIIDLEDPIEKVGSRSQRRHARRALREVRVEACADPSEFVGEWDGLYRQLMEKYNVQGIRAFSKKAFEVQLSMPDVTVLQAFIEGEVIGAQIYFQQDDVVHCHLGAVSEKGYEVNAFYALDFFSVEYFSDRAKKIDLGGGAGLAGGTDGLSRYKESWSSYTVPVYFCGRIMDPKRYAEITTQFGCEGTEYFPAYRSGEFS